MIYINLEGKTPPAKWLTKAKKVTDELEAAGTPEKRAEIIDKNAKVWGALKQWLLDQANGKCWFSEAKDCFSHWDVEHFRPKKNAKDMDGTVREGYWWLAFNWGNFRICGKVGNVKKGTFFPLKAGSPAATSQNRNTDDELYYLLDPTKRQDPLLLSFREDGGACPREDLKGWNLQRADFSIKRLKLDEHQPIRDARKEVWQECRRRVNKCAKILMDLDENPTAAKREAAECELGEIKAMTEPKKALSAVARECLRLSALPWALRIAGAG